MFLSVCAVLLVLTASPSATEVSPDDLLGASFKLMNVVPPLDLPPDEGGLEDLSRGRTLPLPDVAVVEHVRGPVATAPPHPVTSLGFSKEGLLLAEAAEPGAEHPRVYALGPDGTWSAIPAGAPEGWQPVVGAIRGFEFEMPYLTGGIGADEMAKMPYQLSFGEKDEDRPERISAIAASKTASGDHTVIWFGTNRGLFSCIPGVSEWAELDRSNGSPLSEDIRALAVDGSGSLWLGTSRGISIRTPEGSWRHITGRQGLPYEDVTALHIGADGDVWIGTTRGAALYKPRAEGRKWFYRQGQRYLPGDHVYAVAAASDGSAVYFATDGGLGRLDLVERTLFERAEIIEDLVNQRHRRLGLVAASNLDNALNPTSYDIPDNDNDGLWTAYHVAAMSLAYGTTGEDRYKASAQESMHALVMLQNASGTPGLVARSVLPPAEGRQRNEELNAQRARRGLPPFDQWQPTPDGTLYWKSDTSSDEIDGHYLAFYTYYEHIARHDPEERALIQKQVRDLTNYIVDNNYQLIDWTGKRTRWGFWNPESLNDDPQNYLENGLNSLQILSFLKTAHYVTGDEKFKDHYRALIVDHGYLNNVLLSKKVFPDENNHSDDQLGFVAWYPILQLERDPAVRHALLLGVRRHYTIVKPEGPSLYTFAYATIDPDHADIAAGVRNLQQIPTDRRQWRQDNSHRADVTFDTRLDRFGKPQFIHVLPADERCFGKWNRNPYLADEGGDGRHEDDGAHYLWPYWMARYHGFLAAPE